MPLWRLRRATDRSQRLAEAVAGADLAGIEAGTEELVVRAERHDPDPVGCGVDVELAQQRETAVARPLAVGD